MCIKCNIGLNGKLGDSNMGAGIVHFHTFRRYGGTCILKLGLVCHGPGHGPVAPLVRGPTSYLGMFNETLSKALNNGSLSSSLCQTL